MTFCKNKGGGFVEQKPPFLSELKILETEVQGGKKKSKKYQATRLREPALCGRNNLPYNLILSGCLGLSLWPGARHKT